jgi:hypothetical protein
MQDYLISQPPDVVGAALYARLAGAFESGTLVPPAEAASWLLNRLLSEASGEIWDRRVGPVSG